MRENGFVLLQCLSGVLPLGRGSAAAPPCIGRTWTRVLVGGGITGVLAPAGVHRVTAYAVEQLDRKLTQVSRSAEHQAREVLFDDGPTRRAQLSRAAGCVLVFVAQWRDAGGAARSPYARRHPNGIVGLLRERAPASGRIVVAQTRRGARLIAQGRRLW
jgi:hypothetical protein